MAQWIHLFSLCFHKEVTLVKGKLLAVIPRVSAEWSLTYSMNLKSLQASMIPATYNFCSLAMLSTHGSPEIYGSRSPFHYLKINTDTFEMKFASAINSVTTYRLMSELPKVGEWEHYEFHQRYVSGGNYRFFIKMNGEEVFSITNTDAQQFYNMKVYAGNLLHPACPADIKNLELTNFL